MSNFDVIIIGGGIVGTTAACALGREGVRVALIEAHAATTAAGELAADPRRYAITRASERIFRSLGAWDGMAAQDMCAFRNMEVWDAAGNGVTHFDCAELGEPCLGYIVGPQALHSALMQTQDALDTVTLLSPAHFRDIRIHTDAVEVLLEDGRSLTAGLVVGADGKRSRVRASLGIETTVHDYGQGSLVALVQTARPHQDTAWQRFLPGGPLAFLPMSSGWSSIVWTLPTAEGERIMALDTDAFHRELGEAFGFRLGEIVASGERRVFPLKRMHAEHYVRARGALIGDAAHAIHPLAGQGVNLGLLDAAVLAEVVAAAVRAGRDPGDLAVLRRYERWRRGDNLLMMSAMDAFNRMFSNRQPLLGWLRNAGLSLADRAGPARQLLMRHAMGLSGDLPALARASTSGTSATH